ncbi:MAG: peptidylprolyl isomerase [Pseudomonadota bacterium]
MARNFRLSFQRRNGNLHVDPHGVLDGGSAWELINLIQCQYQGRGSVFVDAKGVTEILPFASHIIKNNLADKAVPLGNLFFKGEKGREIAPDGCRVLTAAKKGCCRGGNKCRGCRCQGGGHDPDKPDQEH